MSNTFWAVLLATIAGAVFTSPLWLDPVADGVSDLIDAVAYRARLLRWRLARTVGRGER